MLQEKTISVHLEYADDLHGNLPPMVIDRVKVLDHAQNQESEFLTSGDIILVCVSLLSKIRDSAGYEAIASMLNEITKQVMLGRSALLEDLENNLKSAQENEQQ
jgi:hypothetical protein